MDAKDEPRSQPEDSSGAGREPTSIRIQRRRDGQAPEISLRETVPGSKPGQRSLRLQRSSEQKLRRIGESAFEATRAVLKPSTPLGRVWAATRGVLIGEPLASSQLAHQRLTKIKALAIFSSDALSSSAYATEEILLILILAGSGALGNAIPISLAIAALTVIVVTSYRQTIRAYPNGGGAYIVASENLGVLPGLTAGAALFVDYIMTVSVSTAAGVEAITSAAPSLHNSSFLEVDAKIWLALGCVFLITLGNLRGIRESGTIFAIPTYFFILSFGSMVLVGLVRLILGADMAATPENLVQVGSEDVGVFLILRAFSSGSAALTGIEAVANGVPNFQPPESKNAATTQAWMAVILVAFFVGVTVLANQVGGIAPSNTQTIVAQIAEAVFENKFLYYVVQVATALILVLAANTAFAGLPTLASVMAKDSVMPRQFAFRGDRLAFSNGIIVLGVASSAVLVYFGASTHKIIPLYAFGVFMAFTLSQAGMVVHWRRTRGPGWRRALDRTQPNQMVTVVLPEFITHHWWQAFLHNQLSLRLKKALIHRPNTVVVDVPYHLQR